MVPCGLKQVVQAGWTTGLVVTFMFKAKCRSRGLDLPERWGVVACRKRTSPHEAIDSHLSQKSLLIQHQVLFG
jgi:hypothetical protein